MRIGELARRAGITVSTVRFLERRGLIDGPRRLDNGYRSYSDRHLERIRFIRHGQTLGFTLREVKSILTIRDRRSLTPAEIAELATNKLAALDQQILDLQRNREALMAAMNAGSNCLAAPATEDASPPMEEAAR
jgi:DNA-binding transcriptional MerR regulator